uniref:Neur_chan_LBD domain-containing protein n=1 Tax=Bursaphelenchus xylophilus TaxID=6326 RepID=A0A1I7RM70_BURXY
MATVGRRTGPWPALLLLVCGCTLLRLCLARANILHQKLQKNSHAPPVEPGQPLRVMIGIYVESIGKFQSTEMSFDADLYLYMNWKDPQLAHNEGEYILINDPKLREHIWMPDLYFSNSRSAKFHDVMVPNFSIFVAEDGNIAYSGRLTITVACNLNLVNYPMDRQKCQIRTLSYAYIANKVNITWFSKEPIRKNSAIGLPEFVIDEISPSYCDGTYRYAFMDHSYKEDRFSCLEVNIYLRRAIGYHLVQSFTPTALIVIISWVSFWIGMIPNPYTQMVKRARPPSQRREPIRNPIQQNEFIRTGFEYSRKGLTVDKYSRIAFPVAFLLFNVAYWWYYLWYLTEFPVE